MMPYRAETSRSRLLRTTCLLGVALSLPTVAAGQTSNLNADTAKSNGSTSETTGKGIEEIVVTAQKRKQNLQDVPISITALDTRKLSQLQVQQFQDYVRYLPSVSTSGSGPGGSATVVVRGIATDGGNYVQGALPTVGIYLDEQPITSISGAIDLHIYDIARVEALSGPQGTLFGASSEAGTLRVITNKPDPTHFSAGYDIEANKFTGGAVGGITEGFVNLPIDNMIALRAVGFYDHSGGYIDNLYSSRTYPTSGITVNNGKYAAPNYNPVDTGGGRAALAIRLDQDWTVTPSVVGQQQYHTGSFSEFPQRDNGGNALVTQRYGEEDQRDAFYQAGLTITGKIADLDLTYSGSYLRRHDYGNNDYADYSYFYDVLDGSGAHYFNNAGKLIDPTQTFTPSGTDQKISQELRLATPTTWFIHGIAGIFYQHQKQDFRYDYHVGDLADTINVTGNPDTYYLDIGRRIDRDFAVFTQWDYNITDKLTLTAGMRYYTYRNTLTDFNGTKGAEAGCIGPATLPGEPCTSLGTIGNSGQVDPVGVSGNGFTYRFGLTYKFDRDHMVYGTISDGFRPGGANSRSTVNPGASITYGAEKLTNYEIGTKNTFFNRHLTLDTTLFWEDWNDIQLSIETFSALTGTGGIYTIQNAGKARSRGAEFSGALTPIEGLTLTSASTYTDATLQQTYNNGFSVVAPKGEQLPYTPRWKSNLIARYEFDTAHDILAHVQVAEVYQSTAWNNFETANRVIFGRRNAYGTTDIAAGAERNRTTLELYATNLLDRRGITGKSFGCGVSTCAADIYVQYNQPRLIGIRLGQRF